MSERGQATRERLIATASRLFGDHGFDGTAVEAVLQESGVSRGALYHHFASKEALFDAVLERMDVDITRQTVAAVDRAADPVERLRQGCVAWLRLARQPQVQRIFLLDAPAVVGWQRWRQLEEGHGLAMVKGGLDAVAAAGLLPSRHVEIFAHMLLAALNEVALVVAWAEDPDDAAAAGEEAIDELLRRLLSAPTSS
ncbi:MAG TPA: TetR/AcrR family transcriptional regulator [Micromonosporaceae bacterium]|nr:TetR/AcrR family transcriptional regulator [Micromonosporaceae bacterium]